MYTRDIQAPRNSPIENGKPLAGTWNKAFTQVDLLDIHRPYAWPLPRWLMDWRIKEWECFSMHDEHFFLEAYLANFKLYQIVQIFLYNKGNKENYTFRKLMPGKSWHLPSKLDNASVECRTPGFFFRIHTWLIAGTVKLDIDIAASKQQPAFTAHLAYNMSVKEVTPLVVSLNFNERRNMYAFKAMTAVRGDIVLGGQHYNLDPGRCTGFFSDSKGYFPYHLKGVYCGSMGFDSEGRRFGFHLAENQAKEIRKNNENALWINGRLTPLPPVRITMSNEPQSEWVIQDVDGMVDLVFTPKIINKFGVNFPVSNGDFFAPMGHYNGMLLSAKGEQIQMRNQWGIGEKLYLRV